MKKIWKGTVLAVCLLLCLLLTGCVVPPDDDVTTGGFTGGDYQDVAPRITPSPTPSPTPYRAETSTPDPIDNWYEMWDETPTPTVPSGLTVNTTGGSIAGIGLVTPNTSNTTRPAVVTTRAATTTRPATPTPASPGTQACLLLPGELGLTSGEGWNPAGKGGFLDKW